MGEVDPLSLFSLDGRVAVVTGAAHGLGHAIALGLAGAGARVVGADVDDARLDEAMARVGTRRVETRAVRCDVGSAEDVDRLFERVDRDFGRLDILVNNAGINVVAEAAADYPLEGWERTLGTNLTGAFLCARAAGGR